MTLEGAFRTAVEEEAADLVALADGLRRQCHSHGFDLLIAQIQRVPDKARSAREAEKALEAGALQLRRRWLDFADTETHRSYRSPPVEQTVQTPTRPFNNFGYERELQPESLEARCPGFFGAPPIGWRADHFLFSSGQAAMTAALHLAEKMIPEQTRHPLSIIHAGAYFETSELLGMLPTRFKTLATGGSSLSMHWDSAELVLVEPVFYEERFTSIKTTDVVKRLGAESRPIILFDDTLTGGHADAPADLEELSKVHPRAVMRVASGLKLLQGGLELANVGIVSLYTNPPEPVAGDSMRRLRSLLGLGLRFSDVAGLEAPWFLDGDYTRRHRGAVFAHNEALAATLEESARSFSAVSHPSIDEPGGIAPFCVLRQNTCDVADYEALASRIRDEADRRDILLERGGSFGFRGHRYDVVAPANAPPFLRVAMGRRRGWSFHGALELLRDI